MEEKNSSDGEVEDGASGEKKQSNFELPRRIFSFLICQYKKLWVDDEAGKTSPTTLAHKTQNPKRNLELQHSSVARA